jgi:hypothetical protein
MSLLLRPRLVVQVVGGEGGVEGAREGRGLLGLLGLDHLALMALRMGWYVSNQERVAKHSSMTGRSSGKRMGWNPHLLLVGSLLQHLLLLLLLLMVVVVVVVVVGGLMEGRWGRDCRLGLQGTVGCLAAMSMTDASRRFKVAICKQQQQQRVQQVGLGLAQGMRRWSW